MNKIYKIAELANEITDDEIVEIKQIIESQRTYVHPFKLATVEKQHKLANHNQAVLDAVVALQCAVADGEEIEDMDVKEESLYCPLIIPDEDKWIDNWAETPDQYKEDEYLVKTYDGTVTLAKWVFPLIATVEEKRVCDWEEKFCEDVAYWQENPLRRAWQKYPENKPVECGKYEVRLKGGAVEKDEWVAWSAGIHTWWLNDDTNLAVPEDCHVVEWRRLQEEEAANE